MNRLYAFVIIFAFFPLFSRATSTGGGTTRAVSIDGIISQGAANGTNGGSWELDEKSTTSTSGVSFFYTWDDTYLYLAWEGGSAAQQHILFLDTDPANPASGGTGSTAGPNYGGYTASLPYTANFFANMQSSYNEYRNWSGSWPAGITGGILVATSGANLEARIPWSAVTGGRPAFIYLTTFINDPAGCSGSGYQYGFAPSGARTDNCSSGAPAVSNWYYSQVISGQAPTGNAGSVPVELTRFSARSQAETVVLEWETATERNNDRFEIERSTDLRFWINLDDVPSLNGNAVYTQTYQYTDLYPLSGVNYYRLRQVDRDGGIHYSGAVGATVGNHPKAMIWPNPVQEDYISIQLVDHYASLRLRLWDGQGRLLFDQTYDEVSESTMLQAPVAHKGVYWVQLNEEQTIKVIKH